MPKTSVRKYKRTASVDVSKRLYEGLSVTEAFQRFIRVKEIEGLAPRTIADHRTIFGYFYEWLSIDRPIEEITTHITRDYIYFMLYEKRLQKFPYNEFSVIQQWLWFASIYK